jgi:hypothetical protein
MALKIALWWWGIGAVALAMIVVIDTLRAGFAAAKRTDPVIVLIWFYVAYGIIAFTLLLIFLPARWLAEQAMLP